jgi:hypothetical protein
VLVAGFTIKNNPGFVADKLNELITFIAPQVDRYETLRQQEAANSHRQPASENPPPPQPPHPPHPPPPPAPTPPPPPPAHPPPPGPPR